MIGTSPGDTDTTITRSMVDDKYQEIYSEVEGICIRAADTVEISGIFDRWKEMCDVDSLGKAYKSIT